MRFGLIHDGHLCFLPYVSRSVIAKPGSCSSVLFPVWSLCSAHIFSHIHFTSLSSEAVAKHWIFFFLSSFFFPLWLSIFFFLGLLSKCTPFITELQHLKMDDHTSFIKAGATRRWAIISCKQAYKRERKAVSIEKVTALFTVVQGLWTKQLTKTGTVPPCFSHSSLYYWASLIYFSRSWLGEVSDLGINEWFTCWCAERWRMLQFSLNPDIPFQAYIAKSPSSLMAQCHTYAFCLCLPKEGLMIAFIVCWQTPCCHAI